MTSCVVAFGDLHFPFAHRRKVAAALELVRRLKPDAVVQVGDAYDLFSFSRFPRSQSVITPRDEISRARADAEEFWQRVRSAAGKKVRCHQLLGNHDERLVKRVMASLPEFEPFLEEIHSRLWKFDGVITQPSEREELFLGGVCYMHGFRKHGDHARRRRRRRRAALRAAVIRRQRDFPREIQVRDAIYVVKFVRRIEAAGDRPNAKRRTVGLCCPERRIIWIVQGLKPLERFNTYTHELMHALEFEWGLPIPHSLIRRLEEPIRRLIVDNQ